MRHRFHAAAILVPLILAVPRAAGALTEDAGEAKDVDRDVEAEAKRQRNAAGLRIGLWQVRDLRDVEGASSSETPVFEGYLQKGLDLHLALESTLGFWRRMQEIERTDALGETTRERVTSAIVPLLTSIKLYPFTRPERALEPYVQGGLGLALGIDDRKTSQSALLGLGSGSGTAVLVGFGFRGGAGLDWRFARAFGLTAGARYQWAHFGEEVGGERTYRGLALDAGLTYRFQYR